VTRAESGDPRRLITRRFRSGPPTQPRLTARRLARSARAHAADGPSGPGPCAWNPDYHGWHFRSFLDVIVTHLKRALGRAGDAMHLTVWYADPMSQTVFALATTGYGKACLGNRTLGLQGSISGKLALEPDGTVLDYKASDPRLRISEFDDMMGLTKMRAVTVQSCAPKAPDGAAQQPGLVLIFYVCNEEAESWLPDKPQFEEMAKLLRAQFAAYLALRPQLAAAHVAQSLAECPDSSEQFPEAALAMARVLDVPAFTILARPVESDEFRMHASSSGRHQRQRLLLSPRPWLTRNQVGATRDGRCDPSPAGVGYPTTSADRVAFDHGRPEARAGPVRKSAVQSSAHPGAFAAVLPSLTMHG
jgi:hypothetical protein